MMHSSFFKQPFYASKMRDALERAVQLDPNHFEARLALIDYYVFAPAIAGGARKKHSRKPPKELVDAVREQPTSAAAHAALGGFYGANDKNFPTAFAELESAIKLDPTYMPAWFRIGQGAALSGTNLPRGEEALKKYLAYRPKENEPGLVAAWYYLGSIYEKTGRKPEARTAFANRWRSTRSGRICRTQPRESSDLPAAPPHQIAKQRERENISESLRQKRGQTRSGRNEHGVDDEDRDAEHEQRNRHRPPRPRFSATQRDQANEYTDHDQ